MSNKYPLIIAGLICLVMAMSGVNAGEISATGNALDSYNVRWDSPSEGPNGSMPIGNGDIGANVWVEQNGDLLFYLSKTDAWSENARLLKLGKVRVHFEPNPFSAGGTFKQELNLKKGEINITASTASPETSVDLRFWIDANHPVIRIEGRASTDTVVEVTLEHWRTERTEASSSDRSFTGLKDRSLKERAFPYPVFIEPDTILEGRGDSVLWYHRNKANTHSVWEDTLRVQDLAGYIEESSDPLLNLTFGALIKGEGMHNQSPTLLRSSQPTKSIDLSIFPLTAQAPTAADWIDGVETKAREYEKLSPSSTRSAHKDWWAKFWDRSWIFATSDTSDDAFVVTRGYVLQNWITACGGRGNMPIKFNGSIFTVDPVGDESAYGPDYRRWGSCYWWQNTRLPYWPMLAAGNYDMMPPLFEMYMEALPLAQHRIETYYGLDGAYFPETMYFWGALNNEHFGWHQKNESMHKGEIATPHIQYEWQGGIELTAMMLQYYHHTLDDAFLNHTVLPFAKEIMAFYANRYPIDDNWKLVIYPGNALEDVWSCTNPAPELSGLRYVLPQLIKLSPNSAERSEYTRLLSTVPELPTKIGENGKEYLISSGDDKQRRNNGEKPECYALFPYRLYGIGLPDLEIAQETFLRSPKRGRGNGWSQDPIFAACIGDVQDAMRRLVERSRLFHTESRFPAFWGPNFDWVPDQDHGGVNMIALQHMLIQTEASSNTIHLLPAWPKDWDADFKLHAPQKTIIEGRVKGGKLVHLEVSPESRKSDVVVVNSMK